MTGSKLATLTSKTHPSTSTSTLSTLQSNPEIWYKIHILLYDLCNIASDRTSEARTLATTDELYISSPYFSPTEATLIKTTLIPPPSLTQIPEFESLYIDPPTAIDESSKEIPSLDLVTIEAAIKSCLQGFFDKRRASGDARPCGPHDMAPIYHAVFGITREDLKNERFLGRLRRTGLGCAKEKGTESGSCKTKKKKKGKKG